MNVFPSQIEELTLKTAHLAPHYQLVVSRQKHLDDLTVRVEMKPELAGDSGLREIAAGEAKRIVDLRQA